MPNLAKFQSTFNKTRLFKKTQTLGPVLQVSGCCNFTSLSNKNPDSSFSPSSSEQRVTENNVAIFWDLDNKPPKSFPPFDAAIRLKKAAQKFGFVKYMIAYANRHAFSYVPPSVREQRRGRKALNELETMGVIKPVEPYTCRVCGRRFYNNEKLINHFKQIHEREQMKRLNRIESARGKRRVRMVANYAMKMHKYKNAARDILTPKIGCGLADELKRAGFWVRRFQTSHRQLRGIEKSHARLRCLKTVVVGDCNDGSLKRTADAAFSWQEIMMGKAKKEAVSVVGKWKDRNVLKRLEWTYDPETEKKLYYNEIESEDSDIDSLSSGEYGSLLETDNDGAWWELESRSDDLKRPPE
ncbi:hypothetical protein DH2020_024336 [Rehmannia glutinosa]|uniref:C2H2-type domain-containing protein n=1 Tax=Rehmannia glutinosa TaxID=99300 RepID=A0ABR0W2N5_REHGL